MTAISELLLDCFGPEQVKDKKEKHGHAPTPYGILQKITGLAWHEDTANVEGEQEALLSASEGDAKWSGIRFLGRSMYLCRGVIVKEAVASLDPGGTPAERSVLVMDRFIGISPGRHGQKNGMVLEYYSFEPDTDGFQGKVEYFLP